MLTGWRYYYRRYFGWIPIQFCMTCGAWYWGGLPRWWIVTEWPIAGPMRYRLRMTWKASWKDYCSQKCCDNDPEVLMLDAERKCRNN